jgi:hypothetical protein
MGKQLAEIKKPREKTPKEEGGESYVPERYEGGSELRKDEIIGTDKETLFGDGLFDLTNMIDAKRDPRPRRFGPIPNL